MTNLEMIGNETTERDSDEDQVRNETLRDQRDLML